MLLKGKSCYVAHAPNLCVIRWYKRSYKGEEEDEGIELTQEFETFLDEFMPSEDHEPGTRDPNPPSFEWIKEKQGINNNSS